MAYTKTTWITGSTPLSATNMNHIETGIKDAHDLIAALWNVLYPVGCYFETSDGSFNPNTAWGGTWVKEIAGQVHVSAGSGYAVSGALNNTSDGGSKDAIIPYHQHTIPALTGTAASNGAHAHTVTASSASAGAHTHGVSGSTGAAGDHNHASASMRVDAYGSGNRDALMGYGYSSNHRYTSTNGSHTHSFSVTSGSAGAHTHTISATCSNASAHTHSVTTTASNTGTVGTSGNVTNANMMPHINVYRWHRTA